MSISETGGVISNRDSFNVSGMQTSSQSVLPPSTAAASQSMSLAYTSDGTAVYKPVSSSSPRYMSTAEGFGGGGAAVRDVGVTGESVKRKRGRPRKYSSDVSMPMNAVPVPTASPNPSITAAASVAPPSTGAPLPPGTPSSPAKKPRGRPPGSRTKQTRDSLGSVGGGFTPHVISVRAGEDVSAKILSFSQQGPRAVCVLCATGAISNVTLRQAATSGGTATYEGRFDILCLSGSFLPSEVGGQRSRTGGLSVSLAGQDGGLLGGCVAGLLTAATPVQVIVSSFIADRRKESKKLNHTDHFSVPLNVNPVGATGASSPPSHGTISESSGDPWPWQSTQA